MGGTATEFKYIISLSLQLPYCIHRYNHYKILNAYSKALLQIVLSSLMIRTVHVVKFNFIAHAHDANHAV